MTCLASRNVEDAMESILFKLLRYVHHEISERVGFNQILLKAQKDARPTLNSQWNLAKQTQYCNFFVYRGIYCSWIEYVVEKLIVAELLFILEFLDEY